MTGQRPAEAAAEPCPDSSRRAQAGARDPGNPPCERPCGFGDDRTPGLGPQVQRVASQIRRTRLLELRQARGLYLDAFRRFGFTWHGINAASLSLLLGQRRMAAVMATEILEISLKELEKGLGDRYWSASTGGEAAIAG
jgi:hypothetical protein